MLAWLKKFWWAVLAALAFIAGLFLRGGRSTRPSPTTYSTDAERETLKHEAEAASQVAEVEKAAEVDRARVEEAGNIHDDRERLQRLADMVNREEVGNHPSPTGLRRAGK